MELMQASFDGAFPDIPLPNLGSGLSWSHLQGVKSVTPLKGYKGLKSEAELNSCRHLLTAFSLTFPFRISVQGSPGATFRELKALHR
jgi:hypothetical protein